MDSFTAPGSDGFLGVLKNHAPMVTLLKQGIVNIQINNKQKLYAINNGVLEVDHKSHVVLLADDAVEQDDRRWYEIFLKKYLRKIFLIKRWLL